MATAKLFQHGGSQAVRLPKDFRFEGTEVEIERLGHEVVPLDAGGHVGAVRNSFVVHDHGFRLHHRPVARRAHREREVGVLVVRGREPLVEAFGQARPPSLMASDAAAPSVRWPASHRLLT